MRRPETPAATAMRKGRLGADVRWAELEGKEVKLLIKLNIKQTMNYFSLLNISL